MFAPPQVHRRWRLAQDNALAGVSIARMTLREAATPGEWGSVDLLWPSGSAEQAEYQSSVQYSKGEVFQLEGVSLDEHAVPRAEGYRNEAARFRKQVTATKIDLVLHDPGRSRSAFYALARVVGAALCSGAFALMIAWLLLPS